MYKFNTNEGEGTPFASKSKGGGKLLIVPCSPIQFTTTTNQGLLEADFILATAGIENEEQMHLV